MQWVGSSPLYFLKKDNQYVMTADSNEYQQFITEGYVDIEGSPFSYGENVGYTLIDFTYPGDLIGEAGSTVVDIL